LKSYLEIIIKKVLDKEVGFLMEKDRERLAKILAETLVKKLY
tara:strand:- start:509 stop:634 length:126 start_codon:yes stop_codon:yes gene_type:complete